MIKTIYTKAFFYLGTLLLLWGCAGSSDASHQQSLIVIDAGHGGHDSGAIGAGLYEKDLVLQIAQKTAKTFKEEGYPVYLTRGNDRFIKLSGRTHIADSKNAILFISIHANAISQKSRFEKVEGIETYYLQKTRDARSQRIAVKENASVLQDTDGLSKHVIVDSVLSGPKVIESHKLAIDVQTQIMHTVRQSYTDIKNGGAKAAPFYVLVGASRPSILIEVGYITNTKERARLFTTNYQEQIAKGIVAGASRYLDNRKKALGF